MKELSKKQLLILHGLSAIIPVLILGTAFALHNVYPFGDRQILITDFWQQYYAFISDYWHKIRNGNSLLWSWTAGAGHDYVAHIAYYMASPFNLLAVLFPHASLREVLTVFLLFKIGLAGLFMSIFLRVSLKKCDILLPAFSSFYALCAFTLGYYWNIMWFDTFALMPLVMLGVTAIVKEGKYRLFTISLALAVFLNFYIGLFVCIFVAIFFFVQCLSFKLSQREFIQKLVIIGVCSVIALGISAVFTIPVYSALQNSFRAESAFPTFRVYESFAYVLGNFIAFTPPTSREGLPNLYSGMISVMLIPVFLMSKKIVIREKIAYTIVLVFLVLSVNINVLDFIWNGFTATNMLPFRFSFIASFIVVIMAYKAYMMMDEVRIIDIAAMGLSAAFFLLMAHTGPQYTEHVLRSGALSAVYLALFAVAATKKDFRHISKYVIFAVILAELSFTSYIAVESVRTTDRTSFPTDYEQVQQLLDKRQQPEPDAPDFFRTEFTRWWTLNDPSLYGFDGISFFSSFANVNTTNFMVNLGLPGWDRGNRFYYAETSPLTNAFLNMRYLIARNRAPVDGGFFWDHIASEGNSHLIRNNRYLPFGFMVNEEVAGYVGESHNPFNSQNDLFRRATGLEGYLFDIIDIIHVGHRNYHVTRSGLGEYNFTLNEGETEGSFRFNYEMPENVLLYAFVRFDGVDYFRVTTDGNTLQTLNVRRPYLFLAGSFGHGQIVSFEADSTRERGTGSIFVGILNQELFDQGMELLSEETLTLTEFTDTRFAGTITVSRPRLLYTSLPHANNWRVFVNGAEEEIVTIGGVMAGVMLDAGTHTVEFRFHNRSFNIGIVISIASILIFLALLFVNRKGFDVFEYVFNRIFSSGEREEKISYLLFGVMTTLINWTVYSIAVQLAGFSVSVSNIFAWVLAVAFAFVSNKIWVFKDYNWRLSAVFNQVSIFITARLVSGVVELVGVPALFFAGLSYPLFGIEGFAAKLVVSVVVIILNYVLSKRFVFTSHSKGGTV